MTHLLDGYVKSSHICPTVNTFCAGGRIQHYLSVKGDGTPCMLSIFNRKYLQFVNWIHVRGLWYLGGAFSMVHNFWSVSVN